MQKQIEELTEAIGKWQGVEDTNEFHELAANIAQIAIVSFRSELLRHGLEIARAVAEFGSELEGG